MAAAKRTPAKASSKKKTPAKQVRNTSGGFRRRPSPTIQVTFTGELEGLVVETRQASKATMRGLVDLAAAAETDEPLFAKGRRLLDLCDAVGQLLVSWNYQDEQGDPIPATAEALDQEDVPFVLALAYGWMDAMAIRAEQLQQRQQQEAELPMEAAPGS